MQFDEDGNIIIPDDGVMVRTISCDEKPGIQAIATTGNDLRPTAQNGCVMRDAEYKRLGTLSLLAGIDLLTGEAIPYVSETHKSSDYIELLKKLNALSGIRVKSKEELEQRIYLYFEEINREPVVYHWTYKMDEISVAEAESAGVKSNDALSAS